MARDHDEAGVRLGRVECIIQSPKAICVVARDGEAVDAIGAERVWIPQSQVHDDSEVYRAADVGQLVILRRWAEKQGWA